MTTPTPTLKAEANSLGRSESEARRDKAFDAMRAALKPLAECDIPEGCESFLDSDSARYFITLGEIRAARAALALAEKAGKT